MPWFNWCIMADDISCKKQTHWDCSTAVMHGESWPILLQEIVACACVYFPNMCCLAMFLGTHFYKSIMLRVYLSNTINRWTLLNWSGDRHFKGNNRVSEGV